MDQQHLPPLLPTTPASHSLIIPDAQPTPASTRIALAGQFTAQAPHSMQLSRAATFAFEPSIRNTWCGQTSTHMPQPTHFSLTNSRVATLARYWKPIKLPPGQDNRKLPNSHDVSPATSAAVMRGRATRISFLTPDREVKGVLPVNVRARNEQTAGVMKKSAATS